jgi:hypothetical protein
MRTALRAASIGSMTDRRLALAAVAGGLLWIPYGVLELVEPFGADTAWSDTRAYDVVVDRGLFVLYGAPGTLALVLSAVAALAAVRRVGGGRAARACARAALALGLVSGAGLAVALDPLFTGPRILGTVALGAALCLAAFAPGRLDRRLLGLGAAAMAMLALWPAVYAFELLPATLGALLVALFGVAWAAWGASPGVLRRV